MAFIEYKTVDLNIFLLPKRVVWGLSQSSGEPILALLGVRPGVSPIDDSSQSLGEPILAFIGCKTGVSPIDNSFE